MPHCAVLHRQRGSYVYRKKEISDKLCPKCDGPTPMDVTPPSVADPASQEIIDRIWNPSKAVEQHADRHGPNPASNLLPVDRRLLFTSPDGWVAVSFDLMVRTALLGSVVLGALALGPRTHARDSVPT